MNMIDITQYKECFSRPELVPLPANEVDANLKKAASTARRSKKKDLVRLKSR